jgi:hypothetical protein
MTTDNRGRRTGLIVLWVVFALLLAGIGGIGALFVTERNAADRARAEQQAELAAARDDLAARKTSLTYASSQRDQARLRYEREEDRAKWDRDCIAYIKDILNQMRSRNTISIDHGKCVE